MAFRPTTGPANLMVFRRDGSVVLQEFGSVAVWGPTGSTLYVSVPGSAGPIAELDKIVGYPAVQIVVTTRLNGYSWPAVAHDGASIVYNAPDSSVPTCGGLPHLWSVELGTGNVTQLSKAVSSTPVFVGPDVVWANEEKLGQCGPGGPSQPDGVILAHDLKTGLDTPVDMSFYKEFGGTTSIQYPTAASVLDSVGF
jgi:hypothetical protein